MLLGLKKKKKTVTANISKVVNMILKDINTDISVHNTVTTTCSQAIASVTMSVYKSALGATLKGLKRRAGKAFEGKQESVVIL